MDQLLEFWSNDHTLHTKLFRLNAPFVMTLRVASVSHWNRHHRVLRLNSIENPSYVVLSGFSRSNHQTTVSIAPRLCSTFWTRVPLVLDRVNNTTRSATSSRECVSQVSATTASHPVTLVPRSSPNTRPSPLPVHRHKTAWPSSSLLTTRPVLHTEPLAILPHYHLWASPIYHRAPQA
jgi:hypothetical protein